MLNSVGGPWQYLQKLLSTNGSMGYATVENGATTVVVTDTMAQAGDFILASVYTKGTNACYVVGVTISAGASFTITVSADPGAGGAVIAFVRLPASLLFAN